MRVGVHENIPAAELKAKYPGVSMTREFIPMVAAVQDLRPIFDNVCTDAWNNGLIPMVSIRLDPAMVRDGRWDFHLDQLGMHLHSMPKTWVVYYHEPEPFMTGEMFTKSFKHFRDWLTMGTDNVPVGTAHMAYQWQLNSKTTPSPDAWDTKADFHAADVYSGRSFPLSSILPQHAGYLRWHGAFSSASTPIGLAERGFESTDDALKAKSINAERAWMVANKDVHDFYIYWNTVGQENSPALVNGPLATKELQRLVRELS